MPPQKTHDIFQKELDALEIEFQALNYLQLQREIDSKKMEDKLKSFLLSALRRASMAVVEASVPNYKKMWQNGDTDQLIESGGYNSAIGDTLSTAREITGTDQTSR